MARRVKLPRRRGWIAGAFSLLGKAVVWLGPHRVLHVILIVLVCALMGLGAREMSRWLYRDRPEYRIDISRLTVGELPDWCDAELRQAILAQPLVDEHVGIVSLMDPNLTRYLAAKCEANPWVRKVTAISRAFPDSRRSRDVQSLSINLELRIPYGLVQKGRHRYVVDQDGVRMPAQLERIAGRGTLAQNLPVVKGVTTPAPDEGATWEDDALKGAIETLRAIRANAQLAQVAKITVIDVSNHDGRSDPLASEVILRTAAGQEIEWGRAPTRRCFGELSVSEKIRKLEQQLVHSDCPPGARLNLRFPGGGIVLGGQQNVR